MPIQTYVMEYNEEMVREAITRELSRNGQVYYVYNRVNTIADMAAKIGAMVPDANVAFATRADVGEELEKIMLAALSTAKSTFWLRPRSSKPVWTFPTSTRSSSTILTEWDCPSCISCADVSGARTGRLMHF